MAGRIRRGVVAGVAAIGSAPSLPLPRVRASAALAAGAALAVPGTLGVVLGQQIGAARRGGLLPRPDYEVDVLVDPPWVEGEVLQVAFLGDSLVHGVGAPLPGQSLPAQTAYRLGAHLGRPVRMRGLGIASSRVADVLAEQVPLLERGDDLVVVLVGANDATRGTPPWEFARQLERLAREAHEATGGAPVVFCGLPDIHCAPLLARPLRDLAGAIGDTLHAVQRRLAQRLPEARYVDVRLEVGDTFRRRGRELFSADRYHPNPAGYALIAEAIARALAAIAEDEAATASVPVDADDLAQAHDEAMAGLAELPGMSDAA